LTQLKNILLKSGKKKIAVIGKGDSVKNLDKSRLDEFYIININDSSTLINGDLTVFYRSDYYLKLKDFNFNSRLYLAPEFYKLPTDKHLEVRYEKSAQETLETLFSYFNNENFYLIDFIIISVIKLISEINKIESINYPLYFIGFDFYAKEVKEDDFQYHDINYRNVVLKTQESLLKFLFKKPIDFGVEGELFHIGDKEYSCQNILDFNKELTILSERPIYLNTKTTNSLLYKELLNKISNSNKVIIVAEFTNNHIGDMDRLRKMIQLAKDAGADIIKLQKRDVEGFYTIEELNKRYESPFGNTLGEYRRGVELTKEMFDFVDEECIKLEIPWFTSVLDWNSYKFMLQFDTPIIKLPSTISNHRNYLLKVGSDFKGDLVISTGFTDKEYENFVLDNFTDNRNLFLLQCTSSYPTPPESCQIAVVRHYSNITSQIGKNIIPGYSSHDLGSTGCMLSVAAGAKMIEKHVKLGDLEWIHFDGVALDLNNDIFKKFVFDIRQAELMCGTSEKKIHREEHHKYKPNKQHN
jgi:N-acetylneuraminate synthase